MPKTTTKKPAAKRSPATKKHTKSVPASHHRLAILHRRFLGFKAHHIGMITMVVAGLAWLGFFLINQPTKVGEAASCTVSNVLVNSCRPLLGVTALNYPQAATDKKSQVLYHEQRIKRSVDVVHTYHGVGDNKLDSIDLYFAKRSNTYLFANWKPSNKWADATESSGKSNAAIDEMARNVKALGSKKIFMTVHHEAENDVSGGANCKEYKGKAGTPAEYRAMWRNVVKRFDAIGATNVVWVMDYMNYTPWDCLINDMYPGDDLIDWVMFNAYGSYDTKFKDKVSHFYTFLNNNSSGNHNYKSKPWGIVEWGIGDGNATQRGNYYDQARAAVEDNTFPNLKAYLVFDEKDYGDINAEKDFRVAYDGTNVFKQVLQDKYNGFANSPKMTSGGSTNPDPGPTKDTVPPSVVITGPGAGSSVSGTITITGEASDNKGVKAVTLRVDDKYVATDDSGPYSISLDTTKYQNGPHTLTLRAFDPTDNMGQSSVITVNFNNGSGGSTTNPQTPDSDPTPDTTVITPETQSSPQNPIKASGTIIVTPSQPGNSIQLMVDGKPQATNAINTNDLTNGIHKITIDENGTITEQYIEVKNPLPIAIVNAIRANPIPYIGIPSAIAVGLFLYFGRTFLTGGLTSWREKLIERRQHRIPTAKP